MLELKYAISEIKNSRNGFNSRLDSAEEKKISESEDRAKELSKLKQKRKQHEQTGDL